MKKLTFFTSLFFLSIALFFTSKSFAKDIDLNQNIKNTELETAKKDNREPIQKIDFKKLFNDAEDYFNKAKNWQKLKCTPKSGFVCNKHECKKRKISSFTILDKKNKIIKRCENKDFCEAYKAEFDQSGVYYNVQTVGPVGTLIRILGDSRFKEISTIGLDAYIVNGECEVIPQEHYAEEGDDKIQD
jgi:hypothetical protein